MERFSWATLPTEQLTPLITRQVVHTADLTMLRSSFKKGASVPEHHHVHAQLTTVMVGRSRIDMAEGSATLGPGEILRVESGVPHSAEALEDTVVLDVFTPARMDWQ